MTPKQLRDLAAIANEGHSVELSPEELTELANQLEHPQCGGAAQTMLTLIGDLPRREFERAYIYSAAHEMELTQQRLSAAENENADLRRELEATRVKTVCWVDERRRDAA